MGRAGLLAPGIALLFVCALLPLVAVVITGFLDAHDHLTLANFGQALSSSTYLRLLGRTLWVSFLVSVISILIGWPAAWALARHVPPSARQLVLSLVIIPFITSQLLQIYGFLVLIQPGGPLASLLAALHLADASTSFAYTPTATFVMLVIESLPTAVLVMYGASAQIDDAVLEAGRTLGASPLRRLIVVVWPLSARVALVNFTLTFVMTIGAFAEPATLGGPNGQMIGNTIESFLTTGTSTGFPVALSLILLAATLAVVGVVFGVVTLLLRLQSGVPLTARRRTASAQSGQEASR